MQATRGAPLSGAVQRSRPRPRPVWWVFALVAVVGYVADQVSKVLALRHLEDGDIPVLGDWFTLHLTFNPGAAFGTGTDYTIVFTALAIIAVVVVLFLSRRLGSRLWALGLGLLLAGVAGNLTDRLLREPGPFVGHVVDFLRFPEFPVFNVADVCINVAAGIIILQTFRGIALDGTRDGSAEGDSGVSA